MRLIPEYLYERLQQDREPRTVEFGDTTNLLQIAIPENVAKVLTDSTKAIEERVRIFNQHLVRQLVNRDKSDTAVAVTKDQQQQIRHDHDKKDRDTASPHFVRQFEQKTTSSNADASTANEHLLSSGRDEEQSEEHHDPMQDHSLEVRKQQIKQRKDLLLSQRVKKADSHKKSQRRHRQAASASSQVHAGAKDSTAISRPMTDAGEDHHQAQEEAEIYGPSPTNRYQHQHQHDINTDVDEEDGGEEWDTADEEGDDDQAVHRRGDVRVTRVPTHASDVSILLSLFRSHTHICVSDTFGPLECGC